MELTLAQKKQRIRMMISGAFIIFFTGFPHVWSVYQPYVMEQAGWTQGQASMCFYFSFAAFVFGNIVGGRIQDKHNPKIAVAAGGGIFASGIILSAFLVIPTPVPMYLTYGLLQGFGQGMVYITVLSTAQKWFPGRTGFASGIIVTANGLCGLVMAPVSRLLLDAGGIKPAFLTVGTAIAAAWILCSVFITAPDKQEISSESAARPDGMSGGVPCYTSGEMMRTRTFYYLLLSMMFGLISYFMVSPVSQTHQLELGIPSGIAVSAVMAGSIVNAGTRLLLPSLADKVGRSICIKMVLIVSMAAMLILSLSRSYMVTLAVILMYGCYGGIMGSFPAFTSSIFGMKYAGGNYGFVMLGMAAASFGAPGITKAVLNRGYPIQAVFALGVLFAAASFISLIMVEKELRKMRKWRGVKNGIGDNENIAESCEG